MNLVKFKELKDSTIFTQTEQHTLTISTKIENLRDYQQRAKDSITNFSYHHQTHTYGHQILSIESSKKKKSSIEIFPSSN